MVPRQRDVGDWLVAGSAVVRAGLMYSAVSQYCMAAFTSVVAPATHACFLMKLLFFQLSQEVS